MRVRVCVRVHVCVHAHTCMFLHISFVCVLWLQFSMLVPISQWWQATHQFTVPHFQPSNDLRLAASFHHQQRDLRTRTDSVSEELGVMLRSHTSRAIVKENALFMYVHTVHDTENLTFPRNSVVVPRGTTWIFRTGVAELPRGRRGFSVRVGADFPCGRVRIFRADRHESSVRIWFENGGNQKANFVRNNAKESRNMPQGSLEISL